MPIGILDYSDLANFSFLKRGSVKNLSLFQTEIIQLAEALAQRKDVKKVTEYLIDMRDKYLQNIETLDYLNIYPTPDNVVKMN